MLPTYLPHRDQKNLITQHNVSCEASYKEEKTRFEYFEKKINSEVEINPNDAFCWQQSLFYCTLLSPSLIMNSNGFSFPSVSIPVSGRGRPA